MAHSRLKSQGDDPTVAFAGTPVVTRDRLFVAIRANEQSARAGVACYDLSSREKLWERWLCQANTPATGKSNELISNLLTYDAGTIYCNTNLGVVAAIRAQDGDIDWLRTYERQSTPILDGESTYYRGPNPCVYHHGTVLALPTDSSSVLALDAATGHTLWRHACDGDAAHILGAVKDYVVLFDEGVQILDLYSGELLGERSTVENFSNGLLARDEEGAHVILPTQSKILALPINKRDTKDSRQSLTDSEETFPGGANLAARWQVSCCRWKKATRGVSRFGCN